MKLVDFDGLFEEKLAKYMQESKKKRSAKAWEDVIPKLYQQFGDTYIAKLKCTPKQYYANMTAQELAQTLSAHIQQKVSVPEFLMTELELRGEAESLLPLLTGDNEDTARYAVQLLGKDPRAFDGYFSVLASTGKEGAKGEIVAMFCECANEVKARALQTYRQGIETEGMLEVLSHTSIGDEEVYGTLLAAFIESEEWQLALRAGYLATYGDERALPHLLRKIENEGIGFVEFQELKYAIEALGGEYDEERDFTLDKDYLAVEAAKEKMQENK